MTLKRGVALGMRPAEIFLEVERHNMPKRELLLRHAILSQFDDFDLKSDPYSDVSSVAGFTIKAPSNRLVFHNVYGLRPVGIVEEAINAVHPDLKHLFTNASVDTGGHVAIRGILANKAVMHPYIRACFGLSQGDQSFEDLAMVRLQARVVAFDMMGLPRPGRDSLALMLATMTHNEPSFRSDLQHEMEWLQGLAKTTGKEPESHIRDLAGFARLAMLSSEEMHNMDDMDLKMMSQRRLRFLSRYEDADPIFSPFTPEDLTLLAIRTLVQETSSMAAVDDVIMARIGEEAWDEFRTDPKSFCAARMEQEGPIMDDDDPSMEM